MSTPKKVSVETTQVILGTVLGDGCIRKEGRMCLTHGPPQLDYLKWKLNFLVKEKLASGKIYKYKIHTFGKDYYTHRFDSYIRDIFKKMRILFYPEGKKKVTRRLLNKLTPLGLAVWYMDDGGKIIHRKKNNKGKSFVSSREICLNTQSFSLKEHDVMKRYFKVVLGIDVKVYKSKSKHRLVMNATNANKFIEIISPFVIQPMKYKIDLEYVNK